LVLLRIFGWMLIAAALWFGGQDFFASIAAGGLEFAPVGQIWADIDRESLLLVEPGIVRHVHPALWEWVVFPLLQAPASLVALVFGLALAWLAGGATPRRRRRPGWR